MNHPRRFFHSSSAKAFTVTELLVTISIVTFLAVLLMPALKGGSDAANRSKCLGNLRQIAAGTLAYAADNNGFLPGSSEYKFQFPHEFRGFEQSLGTYLQAPRDKIMFCPGMIKVRNSRTPYYENEYTTYQYFNFPMPFIGTLAAGKPDMSRTTTIPNSVALWGCLAATKAGVTYGHDEPVVKKPLSGMNAVYPDGHAAWVKRADMEIFYVGDGLSCYWPKPPKSVIPN